MPDEITIPLLPCHAINETLEFYRAVGFEVTYQQSRPNNYAVVRRGGIELHFFSMRGYEPANSYSTCYVRVSDVDGLYEAFTEGLRQHYGRIPSAGIPRIIPLKNKSHGVREFIAVDPGGNWIRIGQKVEKPAGEESQGAEQAASSKLAKALQVATFLSDTGHDGDAAKKLDTALAEDADSPAVERVQALVFRAGIAINLGDRTGAASLLSQARQIPLNDTERETVLDSLLRAEELEHLLK
jgi:hypothetical protein